MIVYVVLARKHPRDYGDETTELDDVFFNKEDADKRAKDIGMDNTFGFGEVEEREVK